MERCYCYIFIKRCTKRGNIIFIFRHRLSLDDNDYYIGNTIIIMAFNVNVRTPRVTQCIG